MLCSSCGDCLLESNKRVYVCKECSGEFTKGDIAYFCMKCKKEGVHEHPLEKMKGQKPSSGDKDHMDEEQKQAYLD